MKLQMQHEFNNLGTAPPICYNPDATVGNRRLPKGWHQDLTGWIQKKYDLYLYPSIQDGVSEVSTEVHNTTPEYYWRPDLEHWNTNVRNAEEYPVSRGLLGLWKTSKIEQKQD